jgi:S1-C subfamily serine protease
MESDFKIPTTLSQIGDVASRNGYIETYKSTINLEWSVILNGSGVFDQLNRLIGVVSGMPKGFNGASYIVNSNKLLKIIDSILKSGKYSLNYIKYNLEDYNNLPNFLKKSYGVNKNVNNGVVITVFKPLNYLFGGLNQGMVITAVNGVNVSSKYDLDRQLDRYPKESNVCLSVVKKNGNTTYYYVTI